MKKLRLILLIIISLPLVVNCSAMSINTGWHIKEQKFMVRFPCSTKASGMKIESGSILNFYGILLVPFIPLEWRKNDILYINYIPDTSTAEGEYIWKKNRSQAKNIYLVNAQGGTLEVPKKIYKNGVIEFIPDENGTELGTPETPPYDFNVFIRVKGTRIKKDYIFYSITHEAVNEFLGGQPKKGDILGIRLIYEKDGQELVAEEQLEYGNVWCYMPIFIPL